jgi:hypothetical protein
MKAVGKKKFFFTNGFKHVKYFVLIIFILFLLVCVKRTSYLCTKKSMQKVLFVLLSGIPSILTAQHRLEANLNMPRAGDEIVKQQVEYNDPGRSGENVLWDFSRLTSVNDEYTLSYFEDWNGRLAGMEHLTKYYHTLSNDSLLLWGFENQTTKLTNNRPELLLKFPVRYADRTHCYYHANGLYSNRLEMDVMGTVETEADAFGMLVLPNKDTLRNVLRIRTMKYIAEELNPISGDYYFKLDSVKPVISGDSIDYRLTTDSTLPAVETFRWYAKGYRYPVFESVRSWIERLGDTEIKHFNTAFFFPPQDHYYLEDDEENLALLEAEVGEPEVENPWEGLTCNFYPNPAVTNLDIEVYMPKAGHVKMQMVSRTGLTVWTKDFGIWTTGIHTTSIYVAPFPTGEYVLNMWFDDYLTGNTILKR